MNGDDARPVTVFLSAVSDEFAASGTGPAQYFWSYREALAEAIESAGGHFAVVCQENMTEPGDLLETLQSAVEGSAVVVHLVGNAPGVCPTPASLSRLEQRSPDLLQNRPELLPLLADRSGVSFTQWEVYFAFHHSVTRLIYVAGADTVRSPACRSTRMDDAQRQHLIRLEATGDLRFGFTDQRDLVRKVVCYLERKFRRPIASPDTERLRNLRAGAGELVREIAAGVRDSLKTHTRDRTGVGAFLRAVDTAALRRELERRQVLELAEEHRQTIAAAVAQAPAASMWLELALSELAVANYSEALQAANEAAELAVARMAADPGDPTHRETALDAYLLQHEVAVEAGNAQLALSALEAGGALVDPTAEPALWVTFHAPMAHSYAQAGSYERAAVLIDTLVDLCDEGHCEPDVHGTVLLLWANLLYQKNRSFEGSLSVAQRAAALCSKAVTGDLGPADGRLVAVVLLAKQLAANALAAMFRYDEAEALLRDGLAIYQKFKSRIVEPPIGLTFSLGHVLIHSGRSAEAEPLLRHVLSLAEAHNRGLERQQTAAILEQLGVALGNLKQYAEAEAVLWRAATLYEVLRGPMFVHLGGVLRLLANVMVGNRRFEDAEPVMRRGLAILEAAHGPESIDVGLALKDVAFLLLESGRPAEAEEVAGRSCVVMDGHLGETHEATRSAKAFFEASLVAQGLDEAERLRHWTALVARLPSVRARLRAMLGDRLRTVLGDLTALFGGEPATSERGESRHAQDGPPRESPG